jgi:hypothetical protein
LSLLLCVLFSQLLDSFAFSDFQIFEFLSVVHCLFDALIDGDQLLLALQLLELWNGFDAHRFNRLFEPKIQSLHLRLGLHSQLLHLLKPLLLKLLELVLPPLLELLKFLLAD